MKIKINNIFKNIHFTKNKVIPRRRNNFKNIEIINNEVNENAHDKKEFKRKGAISNNNIFSMLKIFKSKFSVKRSYYILFILMVVLATVSVYTNFITYRVVNDESYSVFNNEDEVKIENQKSTTVEDLQDLNSNNMDTRSSSVSQNLIESTNKTVKSASIPTTITNKVTSTKDVIDPLVFTKPVNGEVIKVYSEDKLLFSKTLESWKTHDGVDVKADLGENVKSIEKGIVEKVYEDSFLGTTIIIDHGQGYKSIYSNLDSSVNVKEKQTIKKSTTIGKVGKTSIGEIKDEPHIHFILMLNNKIIDPVSKINF